MCVSVGERTCVTACGSVFVRECMRMCHCVRACVRVCVFFCFFLRKRQKCHNFMKQKNKRTKEKRESFTPAWVLDPRACLRGFLWFLCMRACLCAYECVCVR